RMTGMKANNSAGARASASSDAVVDWRALPKGSPERKAAIAAERRELAAAARWKKARKQEQDHYVPPAEVVNAGEREGRRLLAEAVWWVTVNGVDVEPPNELTRMLQTAKKRNESLFLKQFVLAVLPGPPKEAPLPAPEPERTEKVVIGPEMDRLRKLLE